MKFIVYTDGACSGNGTTTSRGGWGYFVLDENMGELFCSNNIEPIYNTTNNVMESQAVLEALKQIEAQYGQGHEIEIRTDSKLVIGWLKDGWKRNQAHLRPLLADIDKEMEKHTVTFTKVKGHSGDKYNDLVDELAVEGCSET